MTKMRRANYSLRTTVSQRLLQVPQGETAVTRAAATALRSEDSSRRSLPTLPNTRPLLRIISYRPTFVRAFLIQLSHAKMPCSVTSVPASCAVRHSVGARASAPCRAPAIPARGLGLMPIRAVRARISSRKLGVQAYSGMGADYDEEDPFHDMTDFERETQIVLTRVLTARATQLVLAQLNTASPHIYEWLTNFTRECPPIEGDEFLLKLMKRQPYTNIDPATKSTMIIHPVTLAQQVLAARDELAGASAKGLVHHVKNANLDVIKTHLNQNHYTLSRKAPIKKGGVRQRGGQTEAGRTSS